MFNDFARQDANSESYWWRELTRRGSASSVKSRYSGVQMRKTREPETMDRNSKSCGRKGFNNQVNAMRVCAYFDSALAYIQHPA